MRTYLYILLFLLIQQGLFAFEQVSGTVLRAPRDLKVDHLMEDSVKTLTWWQPGSPYVLNYGSGSFESGIGTEGAGVYDVAIKYEPADLKSFDLYKVDQLSFVPVSSTAKYTINIWQGENADSVVYTDTLSSHTANQWNYITLDSLVVLDANKTYYFGYNVISNGGATIGCESAMPEVPGKSDLIRFTDSFISLYKTQGIQVNINIAAFVSAQNSETKGSQAILANNTNTLKTTLFAQQVKNVQALQKPPKSAYPDSYNIYRDSVFIAIATEANYTDTLHEGGFYSYQVSAVYSTEESEKSEALEVGYDNERIPVNKVITETFINVGTSDVTGQNSPVTWSAFQGITELAFLNKNIAPIIYHATVLNVLGPDPFVNQYSEDRYLYYLLYTNAGFPLTMFNGDLFFRGGSSTESLYEPYKTHAEYAQNRLTPISFEGEIEKVSETIYNLNLSTEIVGMYKDTGMVMHVVLTKDSVSHSWYNDTYDKVRYVAQKMFPNTEGTPVVFNKEGKANLSVQVEVDPLEPKENYKVIAFIQDNERKIILNGDMYQIPYQKDIYFTVIDEWDQPISNAEIEINEQTYLTGEDGRKRVALWSNLGEVSYTVSANNLIAQTGTFLVDTTNEISIKLLSTDISFESNILTKAYPNPVSDKLNVETKQNASYFISNIAGVKVSSGKLTAGTNCINVSHIESGVYFISIQNGRNRELVKIIKD